MQSTVGAEEGASLALTVGVTEEDGAIEGASLALTVGVTEGDGDGDLVDLGALVCGDRLGRWFLVGWNDGDLVGWDVTSNVLM